MPYVLKTISARKIILFFSLLVLSFIDIYAQGFKLNRGDIFPIDLMQYRSNGWIVGLGPTYMLAYPGKSQTIPLNKKSSTIQETITNQPIGKFGFMAELGWFHGFNNPIIFDFMDIDLSYKSFNGEEDFIAKSNANETLNKTPQTFNDQWLSLNVNFTKVWQPTDAVFITNAIGINGDYNIARKIAGNLVMPENDELKFPDKILVDIHYKLGIGFHALPRLLIVPTIEVPILSVLPFDHIISTKSYFNSRYRPFTLSVRFMILRKRDMSCPPVFDPAAKKSSKIKNGTKEEDK